MSTVRAKFQVTKVERFPTVENVHFIAIPKPTAYPADGSDEDNTFAKWTPSADLQMTINNPDLIGKFAIGQKFYVDFTSAE